MIQERLMHPCFHFVLCQADNGLSFIETSALDSSNVELAFQRILTGNDHAANKVYVCYS